MMNLSVSDCLVCLVGSFIITTGNRISGTVLQSIVIFLIFWLGSVSFLSITSISIDRFLMVTYPIKHRILMKGQLIILWIAAIWIVSCVNPSLFLVYGRKTGSSITNISGAIFIVLSAVMYSSTYYKLKKQSRNMAAVNSTESRAQEIRNLQEKRFLNTIIIIASLAVGCVVPFAFVHLCISKHKMSEVLDAALLFIFYTNFAVNPVIYIIRLPNYRKTFYLLYCKRKTSST